MQLGGTPVQLYDQVRDGCRRCGLDIAGQHRGRFPRVEVFELPFIMSNAEATSKAYGNTCRRWRPTNSRRRRSSRCRFTARG